MLNKVKTERRRLAQQIYRKIEKLLHPVLTIDDVEILHEHRNSEICFSAWRGDMQVGTRVLRLYKQEVLQSKTRAEFYQNYKVNLEWLAHDD